MIGVDEIQLGVNTTWLESTESEFHRVVVLTVKNYDIDLFSYECVVDKLKNDIGLTLDADYVYIKTMVETADNTLMVMIRMRNEEQFVMLQLHYYG